MDAKEAQEVRHNPLPISCEIKELQRCIDDALDKQIPQKPRGVHALPHNAWGLCPRCKGGPVREGEIDPRVVFNPWDYCPYCGQALDWSDWEEREP